jgi:hypothetical protein
MSIDFSRWPGRPGDILGPDGTTIGAYLSSSAQAPRLATVGSPEWWRDRLLGRLVGQAAQCSSMHEFYSGNQRLMFASEKFVAAYGRRFDNFPANFMPLVVDAERERLIVDGFRFGPKGSVADADVWRIWQDNQMDAESQIAHEIALAKGIAYAAVDPFEEAASITIEDPTEVVVETAPGNRRNRLAALKVFTDDDGYARAYVYLPDEVYVWRSANRRTDGTYGSLRELRWLEGAGEVPYEQRNPLGVVPIVPLINRPRRNGTGRSEFEPVIGNQLAINFLRYSALVGSDVAALPQRWAKNLDVEIDKNTGKPKQPFRSGIDTIWGTRRPRPDELQEYGQGEFPEVEFGQFPAADLNPFVQLIRSEVGQMASNSRTPYHYLLGEPTSIPPSGESLKSSEAPLVKKVEAQEIHFGEGWEETMRVALLAEGQTDKAARTTAGEVIWRDAETRNEGARTDSILKQYEAGLLPDDFALEALGYTPQQIERIIESKAGRDVSRRVEAAAALVRGGWAPPDALRAVGLDPIKHLGLLPVTLQPPPSPARSTTTIGTDPNGGTTITRETA